MRKIMLWAWLLGLVLAGQAEATTYYVGKSGSDANSCATAQSSTAANRKLTIISGKGCLTTPGDTLIVGDGTYVENEISLTVSGTEANPITIKAENQHLAILSSTSNNTCAPNISFNASWLVIDGLRGQIDPTDPSGCALNSAQGAFVRMWSSNDPALGGNTSSGNVGGVVRNCQVDASSHRGVGIKTNQDYSLVEDCTVESSLEGFNGLNQVFRNNIITGAGDGWGEHFTCKGGARNCQFYNNTINWTGGSRALVLGGNSSCCWWDSSTHYECYNCIAYNNVVTMSSSYSWAVGFQGCKTCALTNNVVVGAGKLFMGPGADGSNPPQPWPDGSTIKNNIVSGSANACTQDWGSDTNRTVDYNDFYNCTSAPAQTHAISGDPAFVNPSSDWHLQAGSPALEAGTTITFTAYDGSSITVNLDFSGTTRQTPWDLGIYEDDTSAPAAPDSLFIFITYPNRTSVQGTR